MNDFINLHINNPLVSIIAANYNKDQYLPDMLQNIKCEMYKYWTMSLLINGAIEINYSSLQEYGKKIANPKIICSIN